MTTNTDAAAARAYHRERMRKRRESGEHQLWLDKTREQRKQLKAKYRREAGVVSREQAKASKEAKRLESIAERQARVLHDAHVKALRSNPAAARAVRMLGKVGKEELLSAENLKELLNYDPKTGSFHWRVSYGNAVAGSPAGTERKSGYAVIGLCGEKFRVHRLAWLYVHGCWPKGTIDHIDTDKSNNRISNLRDVSQSLNKQNMRAATKANALGVLGVYWSERRGGYMASLRVEGRQKRKGPYKTIERASQSYVDMKRQWHEGCTL